MRPPLAFAHVLFAKEDALERLDVHPLLLAWQARSAVDQRQDRAWHLVVAQGHVQEGDVQGGRHWLARVGRLVPLGL